MTKKKKTKNYAACRCIKKLSTEKNLVSAETA